MTINTTPSIPTGIDQQADVFIAEYAERMVPIQFWIVDHYSASSFDRATELQKLAALGVVSHATRYGTFKTLFQHRRAILEALRLATSRLTNTESGQPTPEQRSAYAHLVATLSETYAGTFYSKED